jgi:hypothetical protein
MFQGRLVGVVETAAEVEERIGRMMTGAAA